MLARCKKYVHNSYKKYEYVFLYKMLNINTGFKYNSS